MSISDELIKLPRWSLTPRQVFDLGLIINGGFSPLTGFLTEADYLSVLKDLRLANGVLWPIPVVLDVGPNFSYKPGDEIILCDGFGNPLASLAIDSIYRPDKDWEAEQVFQTKSLFHPGVRFLMTELGSRYVGGRLRAINSPPIYDFGELRYHPHELKQWFIDNGWVKVIAFQTRNPIHRAHYELMRRAAELVNAKVLIHPVVGLTKDGDIDYVTRVKSYQQVYRNYMTDFAKLALLPLAMRMAGPREAVWHAIIRKNYGCTHFIVGRDHAGPGKDEQGRPFYGEYQAQQLAIQYEQEIGIKIIAQEELLYLENLKRYVPRSEVPQGQSTQTISGTDLRRRFRLGDNIPEWFSFPEVLAELRRGIAREGHGVTNFFTGLPSSGKSTIAHLLQARLLELQYKKITVLDGDLVRHYLSRGLGFSRDDRNINIERIGFVASEITKHGGICVCAAIAPYQEVRERNRRLISQHGTYIEVYLATPPAVCEQRDVKGLYRRATRGELKNFTGVNDPYEVPHNPEIILDTSVKSQSQCVDEVVNYLVAKQLIEVEKSLS